MKITLDTLEFSPAHPQDGYAFLDIEGVGRRFVSAESLPEHLWKPLEEYFAELYRQETQEKVA